ncbi:MAG: (d)CMP kinase [Bacillota bacterium]
MPGKSAIAIDGPAGAGKSTVARGVARALGYKYIDTGAMYRAVTLAALKKKLDPGDYKNLTELANSIKIDIIENNGTNAVYIDGEDVTREIRTPEVTQMVSYVSLVPGVRKALVEAQRNMAHAGGVVMEGRDIGTVVLPDAKFKFFLTASAGERAKRRVADFQRLGFEVDLEQLTADIEKRDYIDSSREINPLRPADGAHIIDCTRMTAEEVIGLIVEVVTGGLS